MKRGRVHISPNDLNDSIRLSSDMPGVGITVTKPVYPKWELDDPCLNLAISRRGKATGPIRPGIQAGFEGGFAGRQSRIEALQPAIGKAESVAWRDAGRGIASETFRNSDTILVPGKSERGHVPVAACCTALAKIQVKPNQACCVTSAAKVAGSPCCYPIL